MGLSENQERIASAIRFLSDVEPFCTADDIAEYTGLAKQSILNNADPVVKKYDDIGCRKVGQANVYYRITDRMDEIWNAETESITRIFPPWTAATYAEKRTAPDESEFDLIVHWFDANANEIEGYDPSHEEIGQVVEVHGPDPVAIRVFERTEEFETVEE